MEDFFGGSLLIRDAFSNTLQLFTGSIARSSNSFRMFTNQIGESERANRVATQNMRNQIAQLAQTYVQQGYTIQQAMRRATSEISRQAPDSGSSWVNAFGRIRQVGIDSFNGISNRIQSFSNSTLGMITKITAGFISLKTAKEGIETGFKTGMQFQDSRMTLNTLYNDKNIGGEKFKLATDFANKTPWEEKETVGSLVKLKAYKLDDSEKMMTQMSDLGAAFKSMGQNMDTAVEAYADMMNGEWERMKSFGIKKESLEATAKKMNLGFDNKQGQITNKVNLGKVFEQYMKDSNYVGMTDELSKTASGKLSTMSGNLKKSLAELVGITQEGGIRDGSLFDRFIKGMDTFTSKMNSFVSSGNFDKISNALGDVGGAISTGFSYLMDHPEIASDLVKLSVGLWALGKAGAVISTFTTIVGAFSEGGALAGLGAALAPIAPFVIGIAAGFAILGSALSPDGILNKGIGWLIGQIPVFGDELRKGWEEDTNDIQEFFREALEGWKIILGIKPTEDSKKGTLTEDTSKWYAGKYAKSSDQVQYKTASDLVRDGSITKASSNAYNNKTEVNVNIAKVEKTADIDEIGDAIVKRIDKQTQIRNNLDD